MMKTIPLGSVILLALIPTAAFAQRGTTPLLLEPTPIAAGQSRVSGYVTIEDNIDLFGVYRRGASPGFNYAVRAGYTAAFSGGFNFGGDVLYRISSPRKGVSAALVAGLQFTLGGDANVIHVPFGASFGGYVGQDDIPLLLYGLPYLAVTRTDPDGPGNARTDLEVGVELGLKIDITSKLLIDTGLTVATGDDNVSLALGLGYRPGAR